MDLAVPGLMKQSDTSSERLWRVTVRIRLRRNSRPSISQFQDFGYI